LRKQAEAQLSAKKKKHPETPLSSDEMQRIIHELAVYQIELEMQQDELLQTRTELEESLECYTELYDFAPLGYVSLTREGTIFQANLRASKQLGVDRSHLIGDRLGRFIASDELPVFNAWLERVFSIEGHTFCEVMLQGDGISLSADPFVSANPDVLYGHALRIDAVASHDGQECRAVLSDISMQKQIEQENNFLRSRLVEARRAASNGLTTGIGSSDFNHQLLDKVIHSRIRLAALSYLCAVEQACFVEIKKQVRTTDGNLSVHMRMLETAEYIICDKDLQSRKPQTIYRITPKGHEAFIKYKESLSAFLGTNPSA
jgi:PAS domain-containing protein/DNA-binding transcriptional ArsR family regulator